MVSVNVSQLLLLGPGATRDFDFAERVRDPSHELHLDGPIKGQAHLSRTSDGILVHTEHRARVTHECARCLEEAHTVVSGEIDEEFFPSTDIRTGLPLRTPERDTDDMLTIDEHHEIDLDELLRQNILTNLPLQPLCDTACPGLCATCGERLDNRHTPHSQDTTEQPVDPASPFAQLAVLLRDDEER